MSEKTKMEEKKHSDHHEKPKDEETKKAPEQAMAEELKECKDKYLRLLAEQENLRKRLQKENQEIVRYAIENTISDVIPIIDNFENALNFAKESTPEVKQWAAGFQMLLGQFKDVLHNNGIVAYHSVGNHFDPHYHEAVEIVETFDHPDNTILEEFAKGYKSQNRTIRPARVKVAKHPPKSTDEVSKDQPINQENKEENHGK